MQIEYEATFYPIIKEDIRIRLGLAGAKIVKTEFLQKRCVFSLPTGHEIVGGWLRVRDEGDKITMSLKVVDGKKIENQKEICLKVNDFEQAVLMLESIGCINKAYQETRRELWNLNGVDVCIDEWPWLEPFVEIEGGSENVVKDASELLGFNYQSARFCSVDALYSEKYNISNDVFNNQTKFILFDGDNPFSAK
ncbi:MAG: CYTH domain-containing protein [bacterium]